MKWLTRNCKSPDGTETSCINPSLTKTNAWAINCTTLPDNHQDNHQANHPLPSLLLLQECPVGCYLLVQADLEIKQFLIFLELIIVGCPKLTQLFRQLATLIGMMLTERLQLRLSGVQQSLKLLNLCKINSTHNYHKKPATQHICMTTWIRKVISYWRQ